MEKSFRSGFINKLESGGVLYERDILNILLSNAYGGKDMGAVADKLLARFPSVSAIISADADEITAVEGVSESVALYLKTLGTAVNLKAENGITEIKNAEDFSRLINSAFRGKDNEYAQFYLVNARGKILFSKQFTSGSADKVELQTDEFLSFLTNYKPYGLYIAHNHVNCSCNPSLSDDEITRKIALLCNMCNVKVLEHCIINSDGEIYSYLKSGRVSEII